MGSNAAQPQAGLAWDARPGSTWRGWLVLLPALLHAFGFAFVALIHGTLAPASFRRRAPAYAHGWGRPLLWMLGIRLEVEGAERLEGDGARVVLFNHSSLLDLMLVASLWNGRSTVLYKREFHRVPVIGRVMRVIGLIPVDRGDAGAARASIRLAAEHIRCGEASVWMAPEGTRSRTGKLGPFKMGPFHLAASTGAPIVPVLLEGVWQLWPMGRLIPRPGRVRIRVLPPLPTTGWSEESVRSHARAVRALYARSLPAVPEEE